MFQKLRVIKNVLLKRPILTIFDVTRLCNQRCPMCNIWREKSDDMPTNAILEKIKELKKFGVGYVYLQGGEPTIRKDILQITDMFINHGIKPTIITNGLLLTNEFAEKIAARKCNLSISIDTLKPDVFVKTRGVDKLPIVLENIKNISGIKKRGGNWSMTSTITKLSDLEDIKALREFAHAHGFMYAIRPYIFVTGTAGREEKELFYTYADVANIFEFMTEKAEKENYLASLIYKKHIAYLQGKPMKPCDAMKRSFLLKENGKISPCIEYTNIELEPGGFFKFRKQQKQHAEIFGKCNKESPCFYNDARAIGVLINNAPRIFLNAPRIVKQMLVYGNFF
ncbi:MAG: radical SAM protein [Defluviitaleaceae bacterium]|nr:radical SAM protein [Defluviitaleaceae bacterium]